ncbi:MAG TPA: TIR domain-containing protein, partial [Phycisphaerae bacterium]|nr:TIR domain-containing protein [Phycisphaerae bacterium]
FDVFISYSSKNKLEADTICGQLEANGIRCWIAPRDILAGTEWTEGILEGIDSARIMVLVFSDFANQSPQVRREVERAISKNVPLIPFRIENVLPVRALEYCLGATHWLDAYDPPLAPHINRLIETVRRLREGSPPPRAPAAPPAAAPQSRRRPLLWAGVAALGVGVLGMVAYGLYSRRAGFSPPSTAPAEAPRKVDLLALVELPRDVVEGSWIHDNGVRSAAREPCRLEFPYVLPAEYDLRFTFVPLNDQGPVNFTCVGNGRPFMWTVANNFFALSEVNGRLNDNITKRDNPRDLVVGQSYSVVIKVRKSGIDAIFNGTPRNSFPTDFSNVSLPPRFMMRDAGCAGLALVGRSIRLTSAEVTEVTGHGKPLH